jgi:cell division protein FtsI/penicillin-binding protein 2
MKNTSKNKAKKRKRILSATVVASTRQGMWNVKAKTSFDAERFPPQQEQRQQMSA